MRVKPENNVGQGISINRVRNKLRELIRRSNVMRSADPAAEEPAGTPPSLHYSVPMTEWENCWNEYEPLAPIIAFLAYW